jgi:glutathione synthase/RimK-type ligase-like ATP-grasp enzyme
MKKVLILCRRDDRENYDRRKTMLRGLAGVENAVEYSGADFEDLLFDFDGTDLRVTDTVSGVDIANHDAIFLIGWFKSKSLDDVARAVAQYAQAHNVAFTNSEAYHGRSFTKLSQCVMAALNGVTVTPFLFSLDGEVLLKAVQDKNFAYPYIAKAVSASRGQDNYLIASHDQLVAAVNEESEIPKFFIVQEFIPNDGDYRVLVMGDKVRLAIHRQAQGDSHLNNTSQGGTATLVELDGLPEKVISDSVKLAKLFRREVTGVDMVRHRENGQYYFLEANNMPQLSTGSFVPEKLTALSGYLAELAEGSATRYID